MNDWMNYIGIFVGIIGACASFATAYFMRFQILNRKPVVRVNVKDVPNANRRDSKGEVLQKEGFFVLEIIFSTIRDDWLFNAIRIKDAMIPEEIVDYSGNWIGNRITSKMTHKKVSVHWEIFSGEKTAVYSLLFKPDDSESGRLVLTLYGPFFSRISVPFEYEKTQYFGLPS